MKESTRDRYGAALAAIAKKDRRVIALDCDLGRSTRSFEITKVDPRRFIEMGIAEQDMISTAAGLAAMGKIPFANSFAVFITGHAFDQIRQQCALPRSNVKICGSSAGITIGADGSTHQSVLDVALMRTLPNMTVLVPADGNQAEAVVHAAHACEGPVYIRLSRYETETLVPADIPFLIGQAQVLAQGEGVAFAACGPILANVIQAARLLETEGIKAGIVNFPTLKPFDRKAVEEMAARYRHVISVEEHTIVGGLGSAIAECLAEYAGPGPRAVLHRLGLQDCFGESGSAEELLRKHGLDPEAIAKRAASLS
jgi:transketolase